MAVAGLGKGSKERVQATIHRSVRNRAIAAAIQMQRRRDGSGRDRSSVDFALAALDRRDTLAVVDGRQCEERLLAPLRHGSLVTKP